MKWFSAPSSVAAIPTPASSGLPVLVHQGHCATRWNPPSPDVPVLFLARDRVGILPLHYTLQKGRIIFASEIKSIFMEEDVTRKIDPIAMDQIFTFWTTLPGRTAFENIHELPPGHFLKVSNRTVYILFHKN